MTIEEIRTTYTQYENWEMMEFLLNKIDNLSMKWEEKYDNYNGVGCVKILQEIMFDLDELKK